MVGICCLALSLRIGINDTLSLAARRSVRGRQSELVEPLLAVHEPPSTPISSYCRDLLSVVVPLVPLLARCKFLSTPPFFLSRH